MTDRIGSTISTNTPLFVALFVCIFLLLVCIIGGAVYLYTVKVKKKKKLADLPKSDVTSQGDEELPEEILVLLLTAAAATVLGEKQASSFRVVSFRRIGR